MNDVRGKLKQRFWRIKHFKIDGPLLERWFLKTLINLSFGREWTIGQGSHSEGTASKELVEVAFGLRKFENGAGLYIAAYV